jgi:hypothetical protein
LRHNGANIETCALDSINHDGLRRTVKRPDKLYRLCEAEAMGGGGEQLPRQFFACQIDAMDAPRRIHRRCGIHANERAKASEIFGQRKHIAAPHNKWCMAWQLAL